MKLSFNTLLKNSLPYGLIMGGIFIVISLLLYIADVNIFSIWFGIVNFLVMMIAIPAIFTILGTNNLRLKHAEEKRINYLEALISCFIILFIGFLLSGIYSWIFNSFIDPEYMKHNVEKFAEMLQGYNMPQDKIDEQVANMEKNIGIGRQLISSAIVCVVLSLIMALIVRKKEKISDVM